MSPKALKDHKSFDRKISVNEDLIHFSNNGQNNIKSYITSMLHSDSVKLVPAYATEQERLNAEKVGNMTKAEITIKILEPINILDDEDMQQFYEERFQKNLKKKGKDSYINFYYEVLEIISNTNNDTEEALEDDK